jgi:hypothetical protein
MDKKLDAGSFTNIFKDGLPNTLSKLPEMSFNSCVSDFSLPYLSEEERACVELYAKKYLHSVDYTLIHFSKKIME